jgi:excinuclease UvrABC nuclease subunit
MQSSQDKAIVLSSKNHWSKALPFTKDNISTVPNEAGIYQFLDTRSAVPTGKPIYVGVAHKGDYSGLRHRLHSYHEVDNYGKGGHPTKKALRPHIHSFKFNEIPIAQARVLEKKIKQKTKYNADNPINEAKKHHRILPI